MAADITVDSITNTEGTGIFDKLMESVNSNIETQYLNNRITGSDYANVYLSSIQAVLGQSVQYALQELLTEAQIDGIAADNLLKAKQLEIAQQELAIKLYELQTRLPAEVSQTQAQTTEILDSTTRANTQLTDQLLTAIKQRDQIDAEISIKDAQTSEIIDSTLRANTQLDDQLLTSAKGRDATDADITMKTAQTAEVTDSTLRANTELTDKLLSTAKDRDATTAQISKINQDIDVAIAQEAEILDSTTRANTQLTDTLLSTANDRDVKTRGIVEQELTGAKQRILLETQEELEQYKVDFILPAELNSINKDVDVKERSMVEQETMGTAQRVSMAKEDLIKDEQVLKVQEEIDLLQTEDLKTIYEKDNILPANLAQIQKQTEVTERDMAEKEATGLKQRLILDQDVAIKTYENVTLQVDQHNTNVAQQTLLATEEEAKQYEVDNILPEQLTKLQEEVDLLQTQDLKEDREIQLLEQKLVGKAAYSPSVV